MQLLLLPTMLVGGQQCVDGFAAEQRRPCGAFPGRIRIGGAGASSATLRYERIVDVVCRYKRLFNI